MKNPKPKLTSKAKEQIGLPSKITYEVDSPQEMEKYLQYFIDIKDEKAIEMEVHCFESAQVEGKSINFDITISHSRDEEEDGEPLETMYFYVNVTAHHLNKGDHTTALIFDYLLKPNEDDYDGYDGDDYWDLPRFSKSLISEAKQRMREEPPNWYIEERRSLKPLQ